MKKVTVKSHKRVGKNKVTVVKKHSKKSKGPRAHHIIHEDVKYWSKQHSQIKEYAKENNFPGKTRENIVKIKNHLAGLKAELKQSKSKFSKKN